ncbi:MAG TPA: flagellar biosynthetic protein FliO [Burkholderiales bacterium]
MFRRIATGAALAAASGLAQAADPGSAGSMLQVVPGLALVIGLVFACAWVAKRIGPGRLTGGGQAIKFVSSQSVGARERVVIVEVNNQWLVLGVAPGRVNTLSQMDKPASSTSDAPAGGAAQSPKPPFAAWLEKALAKK